MKRCPSHSHDVTTVNIDMTCNAITQIAHHRCGGWATVGPTVAATGAGGPLVAHLRCAIWEVKSSSFFECNSS